MNKKNWFIEFFSQGVHMPKVTMLKTDIANNSHVNYKSRRVIKQAILKYIVMHQNQIWVTRYKSQHSTRLDVHKIFY